MRTIQISDYQYNLICTALSFYQSNLQDRIESERMSVDQKEVLKSINENVNVLKEQLYEEELFDM